jgi:hypothetical protein
VACCHLHFVVPCPLRQQASVRRYATNRPCYRCHNRAMLPHSPTLPICDKRPRGQHRGCQPKSVIFILVEYGQSSNHQGAPYPSVQHPSQVRDDTRSISTYALSQPQPCPGLSCMICSIDEQGASTSAQNPPTKLPQAYDVSRQINMPHAMGRVNGAL